MQVMGTVQTGLRLNLHQWAVLGSSGSGLYLLSAVEDESAEGYKSEGGEKKKKTLGQKSSF